jgi:hypothetical protein
MSDVLNNLTRRDENRKIYCEYCARLISAKNISVHRKSAAHKLMEKQNPNPAPTIQGQQPDDAALQANDTVVSNVSDDGNDSAASEEEHREHNEDSIDANPEPADAESMEGQRDDAQVFDMMNDATNIDNVRLNAS